jgi:hypothetical protein
MRPIRRPHFESLEGRQLLSTAHAAAHAGRAAAVSVAINGTLTIDNNAGSTVENPDGSTTTIVPVAGQLGSFGKVHGLWSETDDAYGDYEGPDTILIHTSEGAFTIAFNNTGTKPSSSKPHGPLTYVHAQLIGDGTGAFARASESGAIEVTTNAARTEFASFSLVTQNS